MKNVKIKQIHTDSLSCEPIVRRTQNGELLCICQCGGKGEPDIDNRVYAFHSLDNGETWSEKECIYPEDGQAVYCTELTVRNDEITAYLTVHSGRFLDWKCFMMKSYDNGYTWKNAGSPPHFPEYTFIRGEITLSDGSLLIPYQNYPVTKEGHDFVTFGDLEDKAVWFSKTKFCESGILRSSDKGKTFERYPVCQMDMSNGWIWSEPTIAEVSDGKIVMLMRKCASGWLWKSVSADGGKTWSAIEKTDIPNPSNKPKLIKLNDGRIALIHTPNNKNMQDGAWGARYPLALWISYDDTKSWEEKYILTDFPGSYSYSDGFYEDGHILFTIEHNRHTILFFNIEL